ncbi:helix-turn-helix domain-containing protein [Actinacidiphila glaucinigra]|uniref:helix-turn-helix domain-containing protein n=1 Tax=Actinacidiphila glaucinigra TaxID=235986 RepID=UPI003D8DA302
MAPSLTLTAAPERGNSTVQRTLAVLDALSEPGPHPLAEIAARAGLPAPTTHRYLQALIREGQVRQCDYPRGYYARLADPVRTGTVQPLEELPLRIPGRTSQAIRAELVSLQATTGQMALLYSLVGVSMVRMCTDRVPGPHVAALFAAPPPQQQALWQAPLNADASGLVIRACLEDQPSPRMRIVREQGYAVGPSPLDGWHALAAPLWCGPAVVGSIAVLAPSRMVQRQATCARYVHALMDSAGVVSRHLFRLETRQAS